jgi:SAM-dependent methyltransferase
MSAPSLLEAGRANAVERGLDVQWVQRDMRQLSWDGEFDAAFCWWGSFGFFEDEENARFADVVARSPKPGGRFLIETRVLETLLPRFKERFWTEKAGILVLDQRRWDHERGRLDTGWTSVRDGVAEKRHTTMRLYSYLELALLLESAGFSSIEGFDSHTLEPFALDASRLALVARKG